VKKLLNFSTHPGDPEMFGDDWAEAASFLYKWQFDGFELYPVDNYPFETIPARLIHGIHLRFFIFLREIWQNDEQALLKIFDNWQNVEHFYGGRGPEAIIEAYTRQFNLAQKFGCEYVVFHPVHCEMARIYDWKFPYHWRDTLDLCSEVLNESLRESSFKGFILFENLWWPGSFSLEDPREYSYLRERVNYDHCGITLDTGHLLSSCSGFDDEEEAISYLLNRVKDFGELKKEIRAVHLTSNLSGSYIRKSKAAPHPQLDSLPFWQRFKLARKHVTKIDPHKPFTSPNIGKLFDLIEPDNVVFEFTFNSLDVWQNKISRQKKALQDKLWS